MRPQLGQARQPLFIHVPSISYGKKELFSPCCIRVLLKGMCHLYLAVPALPPTSVLVPTISSAPTSVSAPAPSPVAVSENSPDPLQLCSLLSLLIKTSLNRESRFSNALLVFYQIKYIN